MTGTSSSLSRHSQQQQQQHTQQQQNQQSQSSQSNTASQRLEKLSLHVMRGEAPVFFPDAVPQAPEDPLFGLMAEYRKDTSPKKVDLGIGAYRDDTAKPWVLPVVKKADEVLRNTPDLNHEYLPIGGLADFTNAAQRLILGENSPVIKDNRVVSVQTISGTGAVHLGGLFLSRFHPRSPKPAFYVSIPTWANHNQIFKNIGARIADYPYFNVDTRGLDYNRLIGAILTAPHFSVFVFHACAHNPTGVDPTKEQWVEIAKAMRASNHFPFFDCAYQGFASGDLDNDAWAIRHFAEEGFEFAVAQSFAKNLGLYGERVGALHFISSPGPTAVDTTNRVRSQLNVLQRSEISNPPAYGARIASTILNDKALFTEWEENLRTMSGRIIDMRKALRQLLEEKGTPGTWNHITDQIGMFSFTGLTELQVYILKDKWHIYMTKNGRISMAGLNTNNIEYFATAVDAVVRETSES